MKGIFERLISSNEKLEDIEKDIRACGLMCYYYFYDGEFAVFDTIRSPCSFLSNVIGENQPDALTERIKEYTSKLQTEQERKEYLNKQILASNAKAVDQANKAMVQEVANLMNDPGKLKDWLIKQGINNDQLAQPADSLAATQVSNAPNAFRPGGV